MKKLRLILFVTLICQSGLFVTVRAQYSARRLTQRIAPQVAPAQTSAPSQAVASPAGGVIQPQAPIDPEKAKAAKEEALRKTAEFQKKRAEEAAQAAADDADGGRPPLVIECKTVQPDSREALQYLSLSLTNALPKAISKVTMRLVYYDAKGAKIKEWTTQRELGPNLEGKGIMELSQPAYFMPLFAKRVKVEVEDVRFADGTQWAPKPAF